MAFLDAYNQGDGLKAGHGVDPFKSFRTDSDTLACGLVWLARDHPRPTGQRVPPARRPRRWRHLDAEPSSGMNTGPKGAHLQRPQDEVRKVETRTY